MKPAPLRQQWQNRACQIWDHSANAYGTLTLATWAQGSKSVAHRTGKGLAFRKMYMSGKKEHRWRLGDHIGQKSSRSDEPVSRSASCRGFLLPAR